MEPLQVMVIDDELGMRMGVARTLDGYSFRLPEAEGTITFQVIQAESGEDGLARMDQSMPDILLLDYKLPGMDGLEVLSRTSAKSDDMLTVMMTAYASIETAVTATKRGAYDFLSKPFTPEDLRHVVRKTATRIVLARQARKLAEEKRQVRFQFIRVLGHELKAPLAAVEGYLNLLREHTLGTDIATYDQMIGRSSVRLAQMQKLIADLLDMTRIESGQKQRVFEPVNLREAAESAVELISSVARHRGIVIDLQSPADLSMSADRGEIDMILNNLVSNAVKYNRDNGRVEIRLEKVDSRVEIVVSDTGIGMSKTELEKLFGEFVRIKNSKTRNILGSGLGLSILKRLAALYGGDVKVESEEDKGTCFTVTLTSGVEGS